MQYQTFLVGFLVAALAIGPTISHHASSLTPTLTPDQLVTECLEKNPELNYYRAEIEAAKGQRRTAGEWANPETTSDAGAKIVKDLNGKTLGEGAVWSISAAQTFEYPGRVTLRKAIANRQIALAKIGLEGFKAALAARVRALALRVVVAQNKAASTRKVSERVQELISVLAQRPPAGVAPLLDQRVIEANAIALNSRTAEAARHLQSAIHEINQLRGSAVDADLNLAKSELAFPPIPDLSELLSAARSNGYEIRTRIAELEQRGLQVKLEKNERWPAVKVGPNASNERADTSEYRFGVGLSLSLPLWNQNAGKIETARAKAIQAEASLTATVLEVEREVADAAFAYHSRRDELGKLQPVTFDQMWEAAELADLNYRSGALPVTTYLEVQKQYLDAIDALAAAEIGALENRQQIEQLTGLRLNGRATVQKGKRADDH